MSKSKRQEPREPREILSRGNVKTWWMLVEERRNHAEDEEDARFRAAAKAADAARDPAEDPWPYGTAVANSG